MQDNTEEIWKDVVGYDGLYQVSSIGNVRSLCRIHFNKRLNKSVKIYRIYNLKKTKTKGYPMVKLYSDGDKKSIPVHKLVATSFLPNPLNLPEVNHIDTKKHNNSVKNLEWVTHKENMEHARENRLITYKRGGNHHNSKLVYQYKEDMTFIRNYNCISCVREYGFSDSRVSEACKSNKKYMGYFWSINPTK